MHSTSRREAVRFISCSQPMAGAFLNAVPKYEAFRLPSWAMRIAVQRRLGLPLLASAAAGEIFSKHGRRYDELGDVAQNDGNEGHASRHFLKGKSIEWTAAVCLWRAHGQSYRRDVPVTRASRMPQMRIAIDETLIRVRSQLTKLKSRGVHLSQPRATRHTWSRAIGHTSTRPSACKTGLSYVARAHTNKTDRARSIEEEF